jgi:hypothetical protein
VLVADLVVDQKGTSSYYHGLEYDSNVVDVWRRGRVAEGTSLLRRHLGLTLNREFESHRLRQ